MINVKDQVSTELATLHQIEKELQSVHLEREETIRLVLLCMVSKRHMVILGPPGADKSDLVEDLASRFCDPSGNGLRYFSYMFTKFTSIDELLGPVDFPSYKNGKFQRFEEGTIADAQVAFLDEVFKSNSAALNTLLKQMIKGGATIIGASNEMPQDTNDLEAFWDRWLVRVNVEYLSKSGFGQLLDNYVQGPQGTKTTISQAALTTLQEGVAKVAIPKSLRVALENLREELRQQGIIVSDRRWIWCLSFLQANACYDNRTTVEEDDLSVLAHCLWSDPKDKKEIKGKLEKLSNPLNAKASELKDFAVSTLKNAQEEMEKYPGQNEQETMTRSRISWDALKKVQKAGKELEDLLAQATSQSMKTTRIQRAVEKTEEIAKFLTSEVF